MVRSAVGAVGFLCVELYKPGLRPTQVRTQYVPRGGALASERNGRGVKLVIHLESTLRMGGSIPTLRVCLVGMCGGNCHIGCV